MRVQCTTDSESCVYFIFYFINNTFPVQWSYQNVWIYYLYEIFSFFFWPQQPTTSNFEWARKKTGKKIWSNISRLSTNLVKKYCLRKLKENDERKTMKTNRKKPPTFYCITSVNCQCQCTSTYIHVNFQKYFCAIFFFFVSGHFSFVFSHSHIFAVLKSISKQK